MTASLKLLDGYETISSAMVASGRVLSADLRDRLLRRSELIGRRCGHSLISDWYRGSAIESTASTTGSRLLAWPALRIKHGDAVTMRLHVRSVVGGEHDVLLVCTPGMSPPSPGISYTSMLAAHGTAISGDTDTWATGAYPGSVHSLTVTPATGGDYHSLSLWMRSRHTSGTGLVEIITVSAWTIPGVA